MKYTPRLTREETVEALERCIVGKCVKAGVIASPFPGSEMNLSKCPLFDERNCVMTLQKEALIWLKREKA